MPDIMLDLENDCDEYSISLDDGRITGSIKISLCQIADKIDDEVDCLDVITSLTKSKNEWLDAIKEEDEDAFTDYIKDNMKFDVEGIRYRRDNIEYTIGQLANHLQLGGANSERVKEDMKELRWQVSELITLVDRFAP